MESQPLAAPLRAGSAQHNPCKARGAPTSGRPNVPAQSNSSPTTPQVKRRRVKMAKKFSNHRVVQSHGEEIAGGQKAIIKMLLQQAEQQTCNVLDLWSRAPSLRPGPSRSLQTSPGGPEHARPPAEPEGSEGRMSREAARETKRRPCSPRERRPRKAAMTELQPDPADPAAPEVPSSADERDRTPSPAPGPKLYAVPQNREGCLHGS